MSGGRWTGMEAQGAEVVFGDLDDVDGLKRGFKGAYGVYGITDCECLSARVFLPVYSSLRSAHPAALIV